MAFIEIENLQYRYKKDTPEVLKGVSLSIQRGEYLCIVGRNGSGKSTLIRMINGLLLPDSGSVLVENLSSTVPEELPRIRQKVGMVFQNPENQIVSSVVEEDTAFGPENLCWDREEIQRAVKDSLEAVGMGDMSRAESYHLSAGQQQRVALAGVLAMDPECLILDEATSMLNPQSRLDLLDLLDESRRKGRTILSVTHHLEELLRADRVILLHKGELIEDCTPQDLLRSDLLRSLGLAPLPWTDLARKLNLSPLPVKLEDFASSLENSLFAEQIKNDSSPAVQSQPEILGELQNIQFHYNGGSGGIELPELTLYRGERLILTGETGSGKSTLLQLIAGVRTPEGGEILWRGQEPVRGLVMQNPAQQLFKTYLGDDVAFGPSNQGLRGRELALRVKEAMERVGLPFNQFRDRSIRDLSGGEKRKAALAGILALNPELLLLDEPGAGLDPLAAEELQTLLDQLQSEGCTLIIATHQMETAARGDRILYLSRGKAGAALPSRRFFRDTAEGLLPPPAVELSRRLQKTDPRWPFFSRWDRLEESLLQGVNQ